MKLFFTLIICFLFSIQSVAQIKPNFKIGFNNETACPIFYIFHTNSSQYYNQTGLNLFVSFDKIEFGVLYNYGGIIQYDNSPSRIFYGYSYHLIGFSNQFRFLTLEKKLSPFLRIDFSTQIASNYKNGLINIDNYPAVESNDASYNKYLSTKFTSSFIVGCDFKMNSKYSLNLGVGYNLRNIKKELAVTGIVTNNWYHFGVLNLGIIYNFNPVSER